jgi:hypothetical protein
MWVWDINMSVFWMFRNASTSFILSRFRGSFNNNNNNNNSNGFWCGWWKPFIDPSFTITLYYNQLQQLIINGWLSLAPFLSGLRVSSYVTDLVRFTSRSLLHFRCQLVKTPQLNTELNYRTLLRMPNDDSLANVCVKVRRVDYDWLLTANQFVMAPSPLRLTVRLFSVEQLRSMNVTWKSLSVRYEPNFLCYAWGRNFSDLKKRPVWRNLLHSFFEYFAHYWE